MSELDQLIETYVHNYGNRYESREQCIENMKLLFYASSEKEWELDPETLKSEGHTPIPENEWKNYDHPPCAIFFEEDKAEGKVYVKHIFQLKV